MRIPEENERKYEDCIAFNFQEALDLARIIHANPNKLVLVYSDSDDLRVIIDDDSGTNGLILGALEPIPVLENI